MLSSAFLAISLISAPAVSSFQSTIPAPLDAIEGLAEDCFDQALASNNSQFAHSAHTLDSKWRGFRAQAVRDGAAAQNVSDLDAAVAALNNIATHVGTSVAMARAANAVSAPMDNFFALYSPVVPPTLMELDYLGRQLVLDGMEGDFALAGSHLANLQNRWQSVKGTVVAAGGTNQAASYEISLARLQDLIAGRADASLIQEANAGLDLVDLMESLF